MGFLKNKKFWLGVIHFGTAATSIGLALAFPEIRPILLGVQPLINGITPTPFPSSTPVGLGTLLTQGQAQQLSAQLNKNPQ